MEAFTFPIVGSEVPQGGKSLDIGGCSLIPISFKDKVVGNRQPPPRRESVDLLKSW